MKNPKEGDVLPTDVMSLAAINKLLGRRKAGSPSNKSEHAIQVFSFDKASWNVNLPESESILVKDVIESVCRQLDILPKSVCLFGIALDKCGKNWLKTSRIITLEWNRKLYLRLQFKIFPYDILKDLDGRAFSYYLKQCRHDLRNGVYRRFLDRKDDNAKYEMLLRMLLLEMKMVSLDNKMPLKQVFEKRLNFSVDGIMRKYLTAKQDITNCRRTLESSLSQFEGLKTPEVQFVREVELLADYNCEEFVVRKVFKYKSRLVHENIDLIIHPSKGISKRNSVRNEYLTNVSLATYDELFNVDVQNNIQKEKSSGIVVVIEKRNGLPETVSVNSETEAETLISWIDGYYRLSYNLYGALDFDASSIYSRKFIHVPLQRSIAHTILLQHGNHEGNFLVKEHGQIYDCFALYVICANAFHNLEILLADDGQYHVDLRSAMFTSVEDLVEHYKEYPLPLYDGLEVVLGTCCDPQTCGPVPLYSEKLASGAIIAQSNRPVKKMNRNLISIDPSELVMKDRLPKGQFGTVNICQGYDEFVAGTKVVRQLPQVDFNEMVFKRICECLESLKHSLIVRLIGVTFFSSKQMMLFEYFKLGPLDDFLQKNREEISMRSLFKFSTKLTESVMYLHKTMALVHGNIRTRNVFVTLDQSIKLSDSCFDWILQKSDVLPKSALLMRYNWRAPEVLLGGLLDDKSDMWSVGVTLWEMMALKLPFDVNASYLIEQMESHSFKASNFLQLESLRACPPELYVVLESCWSMTPSERPTAEELLNSLNALKRKMNSEVLREKFYIDVETLSGDTLSEMDASGQNVSDTGSEMMVSGDYGVVANKRTLSEASLEVLASHGVPILPKREPLQNLRKRTKTSDYQPSMTGGSITAVERELAGFLANLSCNNTAPSSSPGFVRSMSVDATDAQMPSPATLAVSEGKTNPPKICSIGPSEQIQEPGTKGGEARVVLSSRVGPPVSEINMENASLSDIRFQQLFKGQSQKAYLKKIAERLKMKQIAEKASLRNALNKPNPFNLLVHIPSDFFKDGLFLIGTKGKAFYAHSVYNATALINKLALLVPPFSQPRAKSSPAKTTVIVSDVANPYVTTMHSLPTTATVLCTIAPASNKPLSTAPSSSHVTISPLQTAPLRPKVETISVYVSTQTSSSYVTVPASASRSPPPVTTASQVQIKHEANRQHTREVSEFVARLNDEVKLRSSKPEDLQTKNIIGQGNFGKVYQAVWSVTVDGIPQKLHVAAKVIRSDTPYYTQSLKDVKLEVQNMASLQNDYVVKLLGTCHDDRDFFALITELMPLGSLDKYMATQKQFVDITNVMQFCWQIAKGMEYLHSRNILHRDLAARNILVKARDVVKVSDFGLSRAIAERDYYKSSFSTPLPLKWYAVESVTHWRFTKASDTWSYGITLWEMYSTWAADKHIIVKPYDDMTVPEVVQFLQDEKRLAKPAYCPPTKWKLMEQCWDTIPENRPSFYLMYIEIEKIMREMKLI